MDEELTANGAVEAARDPERDQDRGQEQGRTSLGEPNGRTEPGEPAPVEPQARDYEAERARKLAYRASLTDERVAQMRKHGRPAGYQFGHRVAEGVEGAAPSGDDQERAKTAEEIESERRIEQAARVDDWQARLQTMSFDERVEATVAALQRRPAYARIMREVLDRCREEQPSEEVEEHVRGLADFDAGRLSPRRYVLMLMRTGALEERGYDAQGNLVDEEQAAAARERLEEAASDADRVEEPRDEADSDVEVDVESEGAADDDSPGQPAAEVAQWRLATTDAGLAALDRTDGRSLLRELLGTQAQNRFEAYTGLITYCEEPRELADISAFLSENHLPGLEIDDRGIIGMQPNAYIGKLENAGALRWDGELRRWRATKEAIEVLQTL